MRLGLGTAQFGLDYGVSNRRGRTPFEEVESILDLAASRGVDLLDTAAAYGDAENVLARAKAHERGFRIVTKTITLSHGLQAAVERALCSAKVLGRPLDTIMVHAAEDLMRTDGERFWAALRTLQDDGAVERLGISFYAHHPIQEIVAWTRPEVVQAPASLFDQRLIQSGVLADLARDGVEVHVRSAFHQGLIFADPDRLPAKLRDKRALIVDLQARLSASGYAPMHLALSFLGAIPQIHRVIVGVTCRAELEAILDTEHAPWPNLDAQAFALADPVLLDPTRW